MTYYNTLAYCQAYTSAGILLSVMQSLKDDEYAVGILRVDSDTVISDGEDPFPFLLLGGYVNARRLLIAKLNGITDQILE
jgi:hypothetical protein